MAEEENRSKIVVMSHTLRESSGWIFESGQQTQRMVIRYNSEQLTKEISPTFIYGPKNVE